MRSCDGGHTGEVTPIPIQDVESIGSIGFDRNSRPKSIIFVVLSVEAGIHAVWVYSIIDAHSAFCSLEIT